MHLNKHTVASLFMREDTVVANATTKIVNEQDTKKISKCYVGKNGN